jgi:eukaryotic-like serine/threonine-protein kinase
MDSSDRDSVDDRYELVRRIARGGGGTVWLAHDGVLDRSVALKQVVIPDELPPAERSAAKERVLREAKAAARLMHPGVVTVYDVLDGGDTVHLVMELVDAPTLRQMVDRDGPLAEEAAARIGLTLLDILGSAHDHGIVHRDVKPSNVFVHPDGEPQLTDFGIASVAGETSLTLTGTALGSPDYIAPEQAQGAAPEPGADLWALGATLYFALEGVAPFERVGVIPTVQAVVNEAHRPLERADHLRGVIDALLAKEPGDRPSPAELRRQLEAVALDDPRAGEEDPGQDDTREATQPLGTAPAAAAAQGPTGLDDLAAPTTEGAPAETAPSEAPADEQAEDPTEERVEDPTEEQAEEPTGERGEGPTEGPTEEQRHESGAAPPPAGAPGSASAEQSQTPPHGVPPTSGTAPQEEPVAEPRTAAGRRRVVPLAAAVLAVLALGGTAFWFASGDEEPDEEVAQAPAEEPEEEDDGAAGDGSPQDEQEAAEDEDAEETGQAGIGEADEVPDDWQTMSGATYEVAVPSGWEERAASGNRTDYVDPATGAYLRVDHTDDPAPDPLEDWEAAAADFSNRHEGYEQLRLERVDYRDYDAAVWEYRYREGGVTLHAVNLNLIDGDHAYALNLQSPEDDWDEVGDHFPFVTAGFQPDR